jgi:hypothetical protein
VPLSFPEQGVSVQAFADEPAFLVDALGARVEVEDLQVDAVQADDVEGVVHDQPSRFGAVATPEHVRATETDPEVCGGVVLVEFVENRITEEHAVLATHDRPVRAVMVILPGGEPLADPLVGELLVSAGQAHGLGFCQHRPVSIEVLASQEFKADAGTGQDRLVTEDIRTDHQPSQTERHVRGRFVCAVRPRARSTTGVLGASPQPSQVPGHSSACAAITVSSLNVTAGPSYKRYPRAIASLMRRQKAASSGRPP